MLMCPHCFSATDTPGEMIEHMKRHKKKQDYPKAVLIGATECKQCHNFYRNDDLKHDRCISCAPQDYEEDPKRMGLPHFPREDVTQYLQVFPNLSPKSWKYRTTNDTVYLLEEMALDHLVTAMRMIWNNYFAKKYRECTPVEEGRDFRNEFLSRDLKGQIITLNMLVWEVVNNRKGQLGHWQLLFCQVRNRMKEVGMLHISLGGYYGKMVYPSVDGTVRKSLKRMAGLIPPIKEERFLSANGYEYAACWFDEADEVTKERWEQYAVGDWPTFEEGWDLIHVVGGLGTEISKEFFMSKKIRIVNVRVTGAIDNVLNLTYMTADHELRVDDLVVVEIRNFYAVGKVSEVDVTTGRKDLKWVVGKVDLTDLNKIKSDIAEAAKLRKELDAKLETQRSRVIYESLAKEDPEAAAALARLKELEG